MSLLAEDRQTGIGRHDDPDERLSSTEEGRRRGGITVSTIRAVLPARRESRLDKPRQILDPKLKNPHKHSTGNERSGCSTSSYSVFRAPLKFRLAI